MKIGCWNIHNLKSSTFDKTEDKVFIKETQEYDIFCLQETKCDENIYTCIDKSYYTKSICRQKYPTSRGMVVLINKNIQKGVAFLKSISSETVWLKLSKTHFRFKNDVYLCFVYIALANSSYVLRNNLDILHLLESDIITVNWAVLL